MTSHSDNQEILLLLWNPNVDYRVHKSRPLVPILSQMNPFTSSQTASVRFTLILSSHTHLRLPSSLFPSGILAKTCIHSSSITCVLHVTPSHSP